MTNIKARRLLFSSLFMIVSTMIIAQSDIVVKAMKDELKRNIENLKMDNYESPFFIQYDLFDFAMKNFVASDGAVTTFSHDSLRNTSVRLLVGAYDFNDESYDIREEYDQFSPFVGDMVVGMGTPLGDDYYGIRSDFWKGTESVYRQAAKKYKRILQSLEAKGKKPEEVLHRRFSKVKPITFFSQPVEGMLTREMGEKVVSELSKRLLDIDGASDVILTLSETKLTKYSVNTEGNSIVERSVEYQLTANPSKMQFDFNAIPLFQISSERVDDVTDIDGLFVSLADGLKARKNKEEKVVNLEGEYDGPVLFVDNAFGRALSTMRLETLFQLSQTIDTAQNTNNYGYMDQSLESRLGQRVSLRNLSLLALPTLRSYMGQKLNGAYAFDREGLKAPDTLVLVQEGILRNLTSQRNVIRKEDFANGTASGPGTLLVQLNFDDSYAELRQELISIAEDEGLDYAIIARNGNSSSNPIKYYQLNLATGEEKLLKDVRLSNFNFNKLRKIKGASSELFVHNSGLIGNLNFLGLNPGLSSFIYPKVVLVDGLDIVYQPEYQYQNQTQQSESFPVPEPQFKK